MADQAQAQRAEMSAIEQQCATETKLRCDVITLYSGAMYNLYKYKKYTDVRLVFAPEFDAAFFGGDPDNFEYPRYDLDVCFFRVYENDKPAHLDNYLKWATSGVKDGDLIFVSGNPGSTGRLNTMSQLNLLRDVAYPLVLDSLARRDTVLKKFSAESAENDKVAHEDLFGVENSLKAIRGYESGLKDESLMAKKSAEENQLRQAFAANPAEKAEYGDPWAEISNAMDIEKGIYLPLSYFERRGGFRGELAAYARILVRASEELPKPNGERLREYRDSGLPSLEQDLFSTAPIYKSLERLTLADSLAEMQEKMPTNPLVDKILNGQTSCRRGQVFDRQHQTKRRCRAQGALQGRESGHRRQQRSADQSHAAKSSRRRFRFASNSTTRSMQSFAAMAAPLPRFALPRKAPRAIPTPRSRCA